ncbi:MAG: response regulator [Deltaproteobacteria bacterium]|nr:response regulator [Deltaproteobacteria bacterium]
MANNLKDNDRTKDTDRRILLIDDEDGIRKVMQIILADAGYQVIEAEDGLSGLQLYYQHTPSIVITDIKMPEMDGIEVLSRIKESQNDTEVIMITGHGDIEAAIRALQLDASDFITKPIHDEALTVALRRAKEKLTLKRQIRTHANQLEQKVAAATAELAKISSFQANLIDNSLDGIVAADEHGRIIIINSSAQRLTGYSADDVVGRLKLGNIFPAEVVDRWIACFEPPRTREDIVASHINTMIYSKTQESIPVRLAGVTLKQESNIVGCVVFFQDIREIRRLESQLIQSERLAATGESVAGMAHAIKNIVAGLKGGVYVVDKGLELRRNDYLKNGWDMVKRNIAKVSTLTMDMLTYCKERTPEYSCVHPKELALEVVDLMKSRAEEFNVKLLIEDDHCLDSVAMDVDGMHQCLTNLVNNAIDATRPEICGHGNGRVILRIGQRPGWAVYFEVEDNGCGIVDADRDKLFTTLFSTKGAAGTGLGLLNVEKIVREHNGLLEAKSEPGHGAVFSICLPERD